MKNSKVSSRANKISLALALALVCIGGGQNLLASESTAKSLGDLSIKAVDSKDLSANHGKNAKDSTMNHSKDSKDLIANQNNDSTQNMSKYIILAQNDSATNPNTTNSSDSSANATNPNANQSADSSANATDSSDSSESPRIPLAKVYDLGRIERTIKSSADSNTTISVVTSEDIANNGAQNVTEALRHTQGVFIQPASGSRGEPTIGIRGYSTTHIGLFCRWDSRAFDLR